MCYIYINDLQDVKKKYLLIFKNDFKSMIKNQLFTFGLSK